MSDSELGVNYPCFGEYTCPLCHRGWESALAWRDAGQMCKSCNESVPATGLQRLFFYYCEPCLITSKGQNGRWKYKYCAEGNPCRTCGKNAKPFKNWQAQVGQYVIPTLREGGGSQIDPTKEHRRDLCEKCKRLGKYCKSAPVNPTPPPQTEGWEPPSWTTFYAKIM